MTTAVTGTYPDVNAADRAVTELVAAGFARDEISVILEHTPHHEQLVLEETEDMGRGVAAGAIGGGVLFSLAFGVLALPGVGILAAGPLLAALGAGSAGAVAGGVLGAMMGQGLSTQMAQEYETAIANGRVLVAVHTVHARAREARAVFARTGAGNVSDSVHLPHKHEHEPEA